MRRILSLLFLVLMVQSCYQRERDCEAFKTGKFSFSYTLDGKEYNDIFIRNDSLEITFQGQKIDSSSIRWVNNCEFVVRKINPTSVSEKKAIRMRILSTTENSYIFEYNIVGDQKNKQRGTAIKIN
ncbi:hypothetical protein ACJD0Z_09945 [Flavobacteriaceae bacterium M23B6Z8]